MGGPVRFCRHDHRQLDSIDNCANVGTNLRQGQSRVLPSFALEKTYKGLEIDTNPLKCGTFPGAIGMHWREGVRLEILAAMELHRQSFPVRNEDRCPTLPGFAVSRRGLEDQDLNSRIRARTITIPFESLLEHTIPVTVDPHLEFSIFKLD